MYFLLDRIPLIVVGADREQFEKLKRYHYNFPSVSNLALIILMRVDRLKVSLARYGYRPTNQQVKAYAYELLKTRPNFVGLGFDPAEAGLSEVGRLNTDKRP